MITLLEREFTVAASVERAWDHLVRIEEWPSWARHIKKIALTPPGELGPQSTGVIHLVGGMKSAFRVTEFNPPYHWKWIGPILWLSIAYDHRFEPLDAEHARLIWTVAAEGFGVRVLGPQYARIYRGTMEKAISRLIHEMKATPTTV
jgi:hypothetical protein